jgi:hypothetical protein
MQRFERRSALTLAPLLTLEERQALLPEWVHLARSVHGPFEAAWNIIQALPLDWVLDHIEAEIEPILANEEEDDYWMFLQLFDKLDPGLTQRLARRAAVHANPAIAELGREYAGSQSTVATNGSLGGSRK